MITTTITVTFDYRIFLIHTQEKEDHTKKTQI